MQTETKQNIIKTLNFFNLNEGCLVFNSDFNIYLIKIKKDKFFDSDFCYSLEFVLHTIVPKDIFLKVDFNDQFSTLLDLIKDEVHTTVNQAKYYDQPISLKSKNAFERRLKHLYIDTNYKVKHESIGEGENRQIVIYPN